MRNIRGAIPLLLQEILHTYLGAVVAIGDVPRHVAGTQVKVGIIGTHDAGMLLRPCCLSREPENLVVSGDLCDIRAFRIWP
jgi:hypothetical protein